MFESLFPGLGQTFVWILFDLYGWIFFVAVFLWIVYETWLEKKQEKFLETVKWVFLEVRVDELNEKSPLAMEQVFSAMHAMLQAFSLGEKWTGRVALHMSAELVSIGGRVSYIFKVPERYRNLFESAVFAQYPKAEIREVQDYLANLPNSYVPGKREFDFWGTQLNKKGDNALPIRTYRFKDDSFEHSAQKTTVDSMSNLIEALSNIMPHELEVIQLVIQPVNDDWKKAGTDVVNKLKGLPVKAKDSSIFAKIFIETPGNILDFILRGSGLLGEPAKKETKTESPAINTMSEYEKGMIGAVVAGLSKLSFKTKIRIMYLAPIDKFNKGMRIPEIMGGFRAFEHPQFNALRPDMANVTTDASFKLFKSLEQPYLDSKIVDRKNKFLRAIKGRSIYRGSGKTILTTEELASIFHFPQTPNARVSQIERVQTVKSAPPIDLPIG